ncbi:hypothetical protein APS56_05665 [Pseudalgibacter alginicilyticus]|uniref:Uncharacterized protein n=1 Tax=Pseudalgibacter alginicilyticus TaxID=1736674 RepID=A0A0P0CJT5_9FLAO|nr:hypothetical protein APS56_05665 [Pseudalgibacter alginicilyticus]
MERQPVKVQLIKKVGNHYHIKFPNLKIPVTVNKQLYHKMRHSSAYHFNSDKNIISKANAS